MTCKQRVNASFILVTYWRRLLMNWINFVLSYYLGTIHSFWNDTKLHLTSFPLKPCSCSYLILHRCAEPFLKHAVFVPWFSLSTCATYSYWYNISIGNFTFRFRSIVRGSRSLWLLKRTVLLGQWLWKCWVLKLLTPYLKREGVYCSLRQKVKSQATCDFLVTLPF